MRFVSGRPGETRAEQYGLVSAAPDEATSVAVVQHCVADFRRRNHAEILVTLLISRVSLGSRSCG